MALWLDSRGGSVPIEAKWRQSLAAWCESVVLCDARALLDIQSGSARAHCYAAWRGRDIIATENA